MEEVKKALAALVGKVKAARTASECLVSPDTLPAYDLAQTLAQIGQEFQNLSIRIKQDARHAADEAASTRPKWAPAQMNAKRAAAAVERNGGYRVSID